MPVVGNGQHVRFRMSSWNFGKNLQISCVNGSNRVIEFGGDVEQAIFGPEHRAMRTYSMSKIKIADDLSRSDVHDDHVAAVRAGFADPGVAVDRNIGKFPVRGGDHLVASDSALGNRSHLI